MDAIHSLRPEEFERARPVFAQMGDMHLHVVAILDGTSPGEVFVDDVASPKTAYMIAGNGYYLAGDSHNHDFNQALNTALPRDHYFVLFCERNWGTSALDTILEDTYSVRATRRYYTCERNNVVDWQERIPENHSMVPVDAELLATDLDNRDSVIGWIENDWNSIDQFLEQGFGFCLVHGDSIVSWSLADYVSGDRCEIGITTAWLCRNRGFGTLAAATTAAHASSLGFSTIGWHCWDNNVGSIGVAENVGLTKAAEYVIYINHWVAENITDITPAEFRAFAEHYEAEFDIRPPASGYPHIATAKAWQLSGNRERCSVHLNKAVDLGWLRSVDHLRRIWPEFFWNPDLEQKKEWRDLTARFEAGDVNEKGHQNACSS